MLVFGRLATRWSVNAAPTLGINDAAAAMAAIASPRMVSPSRSSATDRAAAAQTAAANPAGIQIRTNPKAKGRKVMAARAVAPQSTQSPMAQAVRKEGV